MGLTWARSWSDSSGRVRLSGSCWAAGWAAGAASACWASSALSSFAGSGLTCKPLPKGQLRLGGVRDLSR